MDMDKRKLGFYNVAHLSNCIGAVDVTLVAIQAPPVSTEVGYAILLICIDSGMSIFEKHLCE